MSAQTSHKTLIPAWMMKVISTVTVLWSLVWAALGHEGALKLWIEAPLYACLGLRAGSSSL